jgi:exopolysaccharide biosynthesis polyprenyl glycosylphosphotransferase
LPNRPEAFFDPISYRVPCPVVCHLRSPVTGWDRAVKRAIDIVLAMSMVAMLWVPMVLLAVLIRLDSPGPVLFRQNRIGLNGRSFSLLKFRTMHHAEPEGAGWKQATRDDPRITRIGQFLRCSSLDELPQVLNVLRGEMSIVGPRPHAPGTRAGDRLFEEVTQFYHDRHQVRPGLTGLAQVRGWRGETDTEEKFLRRLECDLEYIETWSIRLDLQILWRTIFSVLRMRNAY